MFKNFKNIKVPTLLTHLLVTVAYPVYKAVSSEEKKLLVFTDTMTIIGLLLIVAGIIYSLYLHGDFTISSYLLKKGVDKRMNKSYDAYKTDSIQKREESFNYPLFVGISYFLISLLISYTLL